VTSALISRVLTFSSFGESNLLSFFCSKFRKAIAEIQKGIKYRFQLFYLSFSQEINVHKALQTFVSGGGSVLDESTVYKIDVILAF